MEIAFWPNAGSLDMAIILMDWLGSEADFSNTAIVLSSGYSSTADQIAAADQSRQVVRMEYKQFLRGFIMIPCQIVRTGRRLLHRVLKTNDSLRTLFETHELIRRCGFT